MKKRLFARVDELLSLLLLDRESVEKVTGLPLSSLNEQDPFFAVYHGSNTKATAEISQVELRCPGPRSKMNDGLVILTLNPKLKVKVGEVRARFGQEESFNPRPAEAPRSVPNYTSYTLGKARVSFGFLEPTQGSTDNWPGSLVAVVIDRSNC